MDDVSTLDRRLHAVRPDLADERLRGRVAAARFVPGDARQVVSTACPVRNAPRPDAGLDTEALFGDRVTVFEARDGFAWAQLGSDGYVGYLPAASLGPVGAAPTHRVSALRTFLFPAPDMKKPPVGHLSLGCRVAVAGDREGDYAQVPDAGGWVFVPHLAGPGEFAPDFVAVAERLLGVPYLWGGRTSFGIDCSGLVQLAFAEAGIAVPRDSDMQAGGVGEPLSSGPDLTGLRRGDLVSWRGHIGIMLDGERLLHANAHHMAVAAEPLREAEARIRGKGLPITGIRRPPALGRA